MKTISGWKWVHKNIPIEQKLKNSNQVKVFAVELINPPQLSINLSAFCQHDTVLITGDGASLPKDVKNFESFNVDYDTYCVNRSMLYFQKPINHWGAVDCEEATWFSENLNAAIKPNGHRICRHTIGILPWGFDAFWRADNFEDMMGYAKNIWTGNSAYMAMLVCIEMGYKKIVVAGVPLDTGPHWYEPEGTEGPNWVGKVYRQWMDFKTKVPGAERVRSMSGYSGFILEQPTKEWLNGNTD
jgi:hypothetical protein